MNEEIQQLINNINAVITTNGNEEITGDILNSILNEIVSVLYGITGDPQYLNTFAKNNLVDAINELDDLLGQINTIKLFSGTQDPNTFSVNGGEYEVRDFYMQTSDLGTIALWIYTGVIGVKWLNLTAKDSDVIFVVNRPTTGIQNKLYVQTSDNTIWRYVAGVGVWVLLSGGFKQYEVQGNLFQLVKRTGNTDVNPQLGDMLVNGFRLDTTPNQFITAMQLNSMPANQFSSYTIFNYFDL